MIITICANPIDPGINKIQWHRHCKASLRTKVTVWRLCVLSPSGLNEGEKQRWRSQISYVRNNHIHIWQRLSCVVADNWESLMILTRHWNHRNNSPSLVGAHNKNDISNAYLKVSPLWTYGISFFQWRKPLAGAYDQMWSFLVTDTWITNDR